jgi:hypothetical protein
MLRINVEMLFRGRKGKSDVKFFKHIELPITADKLDIETAILSIPYISLAESRGFTLINYEWSAETHAPTSNTLQ